MVYTVITTTIQSSSTPSKADSICVRRRAETGMAWQAVLWFIFNSLPKSDKRSVTDGKMKGNHHFYIFAKKVDIDGV